MKRIILILFIVCTLIGCEKQTNHANGAPGYFLEPDGYVIASIRSVNHTWYYQGKYGYILPEDYQAFLNGKIDGVLIVKHPYEEGKETTIGYKDIESITLGEYKDLR